MTFRREYVYVVEFWSMFLNTIVSFIEIIKHLIHPRISGVPQSHQAHKCIEEVVQHTVLVEEDGIIYELLEPPMKIFIHI